MTQILWDQLPRSQPELVSLRASEAWLLATWQSSSEWRPKRPKVIHFCWEMFGTMFSSIHYAYSSEILRHSWNLRQIDVQCAYVDQPNWMKNHLFCKWQGVSWRRVSKTLRTCSVKNVNVITSYPEYFAFRFFRFGCFMVPCLLLFAWAKASFFEAPASQDWSFENIYRTSISTLEDVDVHDFLS